MTVKRVLFFLNYWKNQIVVETTAATIRFITFRRTVRFSIGTWELLIKFLIINFYDDSQVFNVHTASNQRRPFKEL